MPPPKNTEAPPPPENTEAPPPPKNTEPVLPRIKQRTDATSMKPNPFWTLVFYLGPILIIILFLWYQVRDKAEDNEMEASEASDYEVASPIPMSSLKLEYLRMKYLFFRTPLERLLFEKGTTYNAVFVYLGDWTIQERLGELQMNELYVNIDEFLNVCKFITSIYDDLDEFLLMRFKFRVVFHLSLDNAAPDLIGPFSSHNENPLKSGWELLGINNWMIWRKYIQFLLYGRKTLLVETRNSLEDCHFRCQRDIPSSYDLRENWCNQNCSLTIHNDFCT